LILTKKNLIYFGVALLVGLIASFGLTGLTYHPVSFQVQQDIYAPITPSGGAEPTISPQYVPGSYADGNSNTSGDKFAPAQAPQVIPTQVLPTITPVPTPDNNAGCAPLANSSWCSATSEVTSTGASSWCSATSGVTSTGAVASDLPIGIIGSGILIITVGIGLLIITIGAFGGSKMLFESSSSANNTVFNIRSLDIIIAVVFALIALYIIAVIIG
jgi:hypothetical protein